MTPRGHVSGAVAIAALLLLTACGESQPSGTPRPACPTGPPVASETDAILEDADRAVVTTNKGTFTIELYPEEAPLATANFVSLSRCGFYDGIRFHRVLAGFVAQAGDPNTDPDRIGSDPSAIGSGTPGYRFTIEPPADDLAYVQYSVSMANAGRPETNGSQFFIALEDLTAGLARTYTIFGQVVEGTDVVDTIGAVPVDGPAGLPLDEVIIERIEITAAPSASPS